ncbi:MAG: acetyltransferase [Rhodocyclaceae bacterium]|nr:MAG: acetyltransferase [Rhodocyclaceae bacterium]
MADIFVFGASGHGKVVLDAIERAGEHRVKLLLDDAQQVWGSTLHDHSVAGGRDVLLQHKEEFQSGLVAIGDNAARMKVANWLLAQGFWQVTIVHPAAVLGRGAALGPGTVVFAGCVINSDARIGANVIVNTGAVIDHDCVIEDGVHVAPGCRLCGNVFVGAGAFLGAGSVVIPGVRIGRGAIVGAGATVVVDVPADARVAGTPARSIR